MWPADPRLRLPACLGGLRFLLQVILKPDPGNAQELYLGSLEVLGIDTKVRRSGCTWGAGEGCTTGRHAQRRLGAPAPSACCGGGGPVSVD